MSWNLSNWINKSKLGLYANNQTTVFTALYLTQKQWFIVNDFFKHYKRLFNCLMYSFDYHFFCIKYRKFKADFGEEKKGPITGKIL